MLSAKNVVSLHKCYLIDKPFLLAAVKLRLEQADIFLVLFEKSIFSFKQMFSPGQ